MKREIVILCLVGPAGSGKTSNLLRLMEVEEGAVKNSVSVTTREPRSNEKKGQTRECVSREEFEKLIKDQALFEYEEIHGHYYGTKQSTIDDAFDNSYDLLFDIDYRGALSLKSKYPKNTVIVFIDTENREDLVTRIKNRSEISDQELKIRLETAQTELAWLIDNQDKIDYYLVNQDLDQTFNTIHKVLIAERNKAFRMDLK